MSYRVNKEVYEKAIREDIEKLKREMPRSLERDHIEMVLEHSIKTYYPESNLPDK